MACYADDTDKYSKPRRRGWKIAGTVVGLVLGGWFVYATLNIVKPSQGDLQARSDAVVSLAPQFHRLPLAQQLTTNNDTNTLVISYFDHDPLNSELIDATNKLPLRDYCASDAPNEILCFTPDENATIGEAYAVAELAQERSWDSLTIVTDTTHAFRTRFLMDRCLSDDLNVNVVVADRDLSVPELVWHVAYENAAFLKAAWQVTFRC